MAVSECSMCSNRMRSTISIALRTGRISAGGQSGGYASRSPSNWPAPARRRFRAIGCDQVWTTSGCRFRHVRTLDGDATHQAQTSPSVASTVDLTITCSLSVLSVLKCWLVWQWATRMDDATLVVPAHPESGCLPVGRLRRLCGWPWHLDGIFSYGFLKTDTKRFIDVGSIHSES